MFTKLLSLLFPPRALMLNAAELGNTLEWIGRSEVRQVHVNLMERV